MRSRSARERATAFGDRPQSVVSWVRNIGLSRSSGAARSARQWRESASLLRVNVGCLEDRADSIPHRERLFALIEQTPALDWLLLSKRSENVERQRQCGQVRAEKVGVQTQTVLRDSRSNRLLNKKSTGRARGSQRQSAPRRSRFTTGKTPPRIGVRNEIGAPVEDAERFAPAARYC